MARQYFVDLSADPPIANLTAVVATVETGLWNVAQFTPIPANDAKAGKIYRLTAGGIVTTGASGTLTITPRFGTTTGGVILGASGAQTIPVSLTNVPWELSFCMIVRTVGPPGANSTVVGTGSYSMSGTLATAGSGMNVNYGGTVATVDLSVAAGIFIGWTLSVAGSCTPQYAFIQPYN